MSSAHLHVGKEPHPELSKGFFTRPAHQCRPPRTTTVGSYLHETHPLLTHTQFHTRLTSTLYLQLRAPSRVTRLWVTNPPSCTYVTDQRQPLD